MNHVFSRIIFVVIFLLSTGLAYSVPLKKAIELSGKNKSELERAIKYYSKNPTDSLKKKAAIFLIENMDGHYSYQSPEWNRFSHALDSLYSKNNSKKRLLEDYEEVSDKYENLIVNLAKTPDLNYIKADFLINNIEEAFKAWESPYARQLTFQEFCEYLLPYRIGNETISDWRKWYDKEIIPGIMRQIDSDTITSKNICSILQKYFPINNSFSTAETPDFDAILLSKTKIGNCHDWSYLAVFSGRALGIPISADFTPHWANRSGGHNWNVLFDEKRNSKCFGLGESAEVGKHLELTPEKKLLKFSETHMPNKQKASQKYTEMRLFRMNLNPHSSKTFQQNILRDTM